MYSNEAYLLLNRNMSRCPVAVLVEAHHSKVVPSIPIFILMNALPKPAI